MVLITVTYFRVTIVKDKDTRQSKGVAFVLFLDRESAHNCVRAVNNKQVSIFSSHILYCMSLSIAAVSLSVLYLYWYSHALHVHVSQLFGRTVKASIAIDNGRATEFIRRRNYTDKSKCYECGVSANLKGLMSCEIIKFYFKIEK